MPSAFWLVKKRFHQSESRAISEKQASDLLAAIGGMRTILAFEDRYYVLIENYLELELCLAEIAAKYMVRPITSSHEFSDGIREANRRVLNLLTAFRLYRDQSHNHLPSILAGFDLKQVFRDKATLAIRVVEALRNYVQHFDLPIHQLSMGMRTIEDDQRSQLQFHTRLTINIDQLAVDPNFPSLVSAELASLGAVPDLASMLREYTSTVGMIHTDVRQRLESLQETWVRQIVSSHDGWGEALRADDVEMGVYVHEKDDAGVLQRSFEVYSGLVSRLAEMQRRNFCATKLEHSHFTSEIVKNDQGKRAQGKS